MVAGDHRRLGRRRSLDRPCKEVVNLHSRAVVFLEAGKTLEETRDSTTKGWRVGARDNSGGGWIVGLCSGECGGEDVSVGLKLEVVVMVVF